MLLPLSLSCSSGLWPCTDTSGSRGAGATLPVCSSWAWKTQPSQKHLKVWSLLVIIYNSSHGISAYILKPRNFNLTVYMFQDKSFWLPTGAAQSVTVNLSKLLRSETAEGSRNDANRRSCSDSVTYQLVLHFYCGSKVDRVCKCKGKKFLFWKNTPF